MYNLYYINHITYKFLIASLSLPYQVFHKYQKNTAKYKWKGNKILKFYNRNFRKKSILL